MLYICSYMMKNICTILLDYISIDAVIVALSNSTVDASVNSSVTLSCEVYGYLSRLIQPQITWQRMNGRNIPPHMITTIAGSRQIQNGGSLPIPSVVSSLTIDMMDESAAGMYTCSGPSNFQAIHFLVNVETGKFDNIHLILKIILNLHIPYCT